MLWAFFKTAVCSPGRQYGLRLATLLHLVTITGVIVSTLALPPAVALPILGQSMLLVGIIEGAFLVGWRLTQLPRSQSLEFLLVSPLRPFRVLLAEATVGLTFLLFITLTTLPWLIFLAALGRIAPVDVVFLPLMAWTWGAFTGLGLTWWAYEPRRVRRVAELVLLIGIMIYLVVGILAAEKLPMWLAALPGGWGGTIIAALENMHFHNPFSVMQDWCMHGPAWVQARAVRLQVGALVCLGLMLARAAARMKGHFHERHYRPQFDASRRDRGRMGDRPLTWWAVRRVLEYAGGINLYVAAGFGLIYAIYLVAGDAWPSWLGRKAFEVVEMGLLGVPGVVTALFILAAVPAAFQYGLWDSSLQDRCRRLELLLMSELDGDDYAHAALSAAWRRGRGYALVAVLLLAAAAWAGRITAWQALAAAWGGGTLWVLYFSVGFWAFARGLQANGLGSILTLGLPLLVFAFYQWGWGPSMVVLPPGAIYASLTQPVGWANAVLPTLYLVAAVGLLQSTKARADSLLRRWYDLNQGKQTAG